MLLLSHSGKEGNGGGDDDPNPQPIMQIERRRRSYFGFSIVFRLSSGNLDVFFTADEFGS